VREVAEALAEALWARLRMLCLAAERIDRLPENPGGVSELGSAEQDQLAEEFALRLFRVGTDPVNYALVRRLVHESSVPLLELARGVGLPPLAVAERVADLVQVNLAARSLVGDQVQATAAGVALVELVESVCKELARRVESWVAERVRRGAP